ncbi:MAG: S-methyl-5'-thioinosine phosphorylase [Candidatus Competibacterales bacterium]|nr:S-methyl-5'-thioinosine phosphorylase [Candidatus Competibacterales bacterium]
MLALIGGTGLDRFDGLEPERRDAPQTPYGEPSAPLSFGRLNGHPLIFLARHGDHHQWPPHRINYRANLWALQQAGVDRIVAVTAVGGITPAMVPGRIVIPDQLIDYTYDRRHSFHDGPPEPVEHIDFTWPYSPALRRALINAARSLGLEIEEHGVYGATQGPRLETAAEIRRLERDGCDIVGMTGMPEAALARELGIDYAGCALVVNRAAGKTEAVITMDEIQQQLDRGMVAVRRLLTTALPRL